MADLKRGWERLSFSVLAECINDRVDDPSKAGVDRYVGLDHLDSDSLKIRRWGAPEDVESTKLRFKPGDIIFGKRRAYQRKLAVADFEGICSAHAMVLRARSASVVPEFLPHFMQSDAFMDRAVAISVGSLSPTINWRTLALEEFVLPPFDEQLRLTRLMVAAEKMIEAAVSASRPLNAVARRLLEAFNLSALPAVPVSQLLLDTPKNGVSPTCNGDQRGRPTLGVGCVYSGVVNTHSELKYADIDDETFKKYRLQRDDVLVVRGNGNRALVGRAGIVDDGAGCFFPDLLIRLRFDPASLHPRLATHLWNCVPVHADLTRRAKSTNGIYKINGSDIRAHRLPVPSAEQQVQMLNAVADYESAVVALNARIAGAKQIKKAALSIINAAQL